MNSLKLYAAPLFLLLMFTSFKNPVNGAKPVKAAKPGVPQQSAPAGSPVQKYGQLHVNGHSLEGQANKAITLRGQSFGWSTFWPQYWNADVVNWLSDDFKTDIIRASMGVEGRRGFLTDSAEQLKNIRTVINAAIAKGTYVIIDWHCEAFHQAEAVAFFRLMAQQYGKYPNVLYELLNEPNDTQSWPQVKAYAAAIIPEIRKYDAKNIIIVGCPRWDQRIRDVADSPLTGYTNLMYTVHFYAATHGQWLRDDCAYAISKNIPVFVTECNGTEASGNGHIDYPQWEAWFSFMESNKISWVNWSVSDKKGELCSILQPGTTAQGGWTPQQLTETGNYIRNRLRSYSGK